MKKLHLDLHTLRVESFTTQAESEGRGTVQAHSGAEGCYQHTDSCNSDTTWPTASPWSAECSNQTCSFCEEHAD